MIQLPGRKFVSLESATKILFSFVAQFGNDEISCGIELQPKVTLGSLLQNAILHSYFRE